MASQGAGILFLIIEGLKLLVVWTFVGVVVFALVAMAILSVALGLVRLVRGPPGD